MICVHNIVAACAVVGLSGREGEVLRRTFWPFMPVEAVRPFGMWDRPFFRTITG